MMFHEPQSSRSGIMAALLAREDVRGSEEALEGPAGFYNAFTGNNRGELSYVFTGPQQVSFEPVTEGLGTRWELLHTVLKMYPTAGYNCPVIDLMTDIRRSHQLAIGEIERITIDMNWLETPLPVAGLPQSVARSGSRGQHPLLRRLRRRERKLSAAAHPHRSRGRCRRRLRRKP